MKRWTALPLAALLALGLTACGDLGDEDGPLGPSYNPVEVNPVEVELPDGGTVLCVVLEDGYAGGIDCDWEGTR